MPSPRVAVVGGGPGGLMAAERLAEAGVSVTMHEQMASVGRKFLLAGRSGLNLTHAEDTESLIARYGAAADRVGPAVRAFDASALRAWADDLGAATFVGSSGRVFPEAMRATPLLRAWLDRLETLGVEIRTRERWVGFDDGAPVFECDGARRAERVDAVVLSAGGASWPKVGSDGRWVDELSSLGVAVTPLVPANCGIVVEWSDVLRERFEGEPIKNVVLTAGALSTRGECVVTAAGLEGGAVYTVCGAVRDGAAIVQFDLHPDLTLDQVRERLERRRPKASVGDVLRRNVGLAPIEVALLREVTGNALPSSSAALAALVKAAPLRVAGVEPVARAISTAGGVSFDEVDERFMVRRLPGVFVCGEMLDWEAPTGGYLLQATFSTAVAAAAGVVEWLAWTSN